jgi:hypothetical protein
VRRRSRYHASVSYAFMNRGSEDEPDAARAISAASRTRS